MIGEGPSLVETLSPGLQKALDAALEPGEDLLIAVRGNPREAFAATRGRLLALKEPVVTGVSPVEVRATPLSEVWAVRTTARTLGGRLLWEDRNAALLDGIDFLAHDAAKFGSVARRLQDMVSRQRNPSTQPTGAPPTGPETARAGTACPKCQTTVPADGTWCPRCGLQVNDPCWECGKALGAGANFCTYCGTPNSEPAVVQCPKCKATVGRGKGYCSACGTQARLVCADCDRPMRKEWANCPECGGEPAWEEQGVEPEIAHLRGDEPEDPSAWLSTAPRPGDAEKLNAAGTRAYEKEEYREAIRLFREATEADPRNAGYWTNLGVAYGQSGDDLQAFNAYRRAVELNPREVSAFLFMGQLYVERERYNEAREAWEKVIQIAPDSEEAEEARENLQSLDEV